MLIVYLITWTYICTFTKIIKTWNNKLVHSNIVLWKDNNNNYIIAQQTNTGGCFFISDINMDIAEFEPDKLYFLPIDINKSSSF